MNSRARVLLIVAWVMALLFGSVNLARADDINPTEEEWAAYLVQGDLSDSPHGWSAGYTEQAQEQDRALGVLDDPWGGTVTCTAPAFTPQEPNLWYKEFTPIGGGTARKIRVDVYIPSEEEGTGPWPALVLVHGGGWWKGCRRQISREAQRWSHPEDPEFSGEGLVEQRFIVFAIDHRLSCESNTDPQIGPLCGWTYQTIDSDTSEGGAAIDDVRDAVEWVRNEWATRPEHEGLLYEDKVAIAGSSSGGSLAYHAAATASGDFRPDAVAGWSGALEFQESLFKTGNPHGCDEGESGNPTSCWTATNRYLGCGDPDDPPDEADPTCDVLPGGIYQTASPYFSYEDDDPPVFYANGGAGSADPELIGLLEIEDFEQHLSDIVFIADEQICPVETDLHATGLLTHPCDNMGPSYTVRQRTNRFLADQLGL